MTKDELFSIKVTKPDEGMYQKAKDKWDSIAKPIDGLGSFEDMICRMAAVQGDINPQTERKSMIIMCADNGVCEERISQTSQKVTFDVAELMGEKKSSVGIMCGNYPIDFYVYDVGINSKTAPKGAIDEKVRRGTANFLKKPAMDEKECLKAIETGIRAVEKCRDQGAGVIATGEMGIGNTTTSTALLCALKGLRPEDFTGKGAGLTDSGLARKIEVIRQGIKLYRGENAGREVTSENEVLEMLRSLGGLDIAGLTGVFIGGAIYQVPIVIDGLISAVAALTAKMLVPGCQWYMFASHKGKEKGMEIILKELRLKPIIHADLALGEGTGAVMLFPLLDMAMALYRGGTFFGDTQIDQYERFNG